MRSTLNSADDEPMKTAIVDAIPLHRVPTDIRDLLRTSLDPLHNQAQTSDVALTVEVAGDVPAKVLLDRAKVAWAITALVGNALRYVRHGSGTMPGGSIAIRVMRDARARQIALEVQDDGPGIPADRLQSLFREPAETPGAGLALSMVRDVMVAHGGAVEIESHSSGPLRGLTVRLRLPVEG